MGLRHEAWRRDPAAYPFRTSLQTRYGDLDANAHLNNIAISRLFEEARLRFHMDARRMASGIDPSGVLIAHVAIDYLAEGTYPEDVEATVGVSAIGNRSYRLALALFQKGQAIAVAECVMVHRAGLAEGIRAVLDGRRVAA
ncbi:MAG: acyl-CoA thioesterase [Sphingomonadaceae bacterium]